MKKILIVSFTVLYAAMNAGLTAAAEAAFWKERRASTALVLADASLALQRSPSAVISPLGSSLMRGAADAKGLDAGNIGLLRSLPAARVRLNAVHRAKRPGAPLVVLLQDVHRNQEAQRNLAAALLALNDAMLSRKTKAPLVVGLEAAFHTLDFKSFRDFPDRDLMGRLAAAFLDAGEIGAASYVGIAAPRLAMRFVGIDDETEYDRNVNAYRVAAPAKPALVSALDGAERSLAEKKKRVLTGDGAAFDELWRSHDEGRIGLGDYATGLIDMARRHQPAADRIEPVLNHFMEAFQIERRLDLPQVEKDRRRVLDVLAAKLSAADIKTLVDAGLAYQTGAASYGAYFAALRDAVAKAGIPLDRTPALRDYLTYAVLSDGIDGADLIAALGRREARLRGALYRTAQERALVDEGRRLALTRRMLDFALTADQWREYLTLRTESPALRPFEAFYRSADVRSERMVASLLRSFPRNAGKDAAAVLVVGGFHADRVAALLTEAGCSTAVVQPNITKIQSGTGSEYLSIFTRAATPLDRLFEGRKLFLAPDSVLGEPAGRSAVNRVTAKFLALAIGVSVLAGAGVAAAYSGAFQRMSDALVQVRLSGLDPVFIGRGDGAFPGLLAVGGIVLSGGLAFRILVRKPGAWDAVRRRASQDAGFLRRGAAAIAVVATLISLGAGSETTVSAQTVLTAVAALLTVGQIWTARRAERSLVDAVLMTAVEVAYIGFTSMLLGMVSGPASLFALVVAGAIVNGIAGGMIPAHSWYPEEIQHSGFLFRSYGRAQSYGTLIHAVVALAVGWGLLGSGASVPALAGLLAVSLSQALGIVDRLRNPHVSNNREASAVVGLFTVPLLLAGIATVLGLTVGPMVGVGWMAGLFLFAFLFDRVLLRRHNAGESDLTWPERLLNVVELGGTVGVAAVTGGAITAFLGDAAPFFNPAAYVVTVVVYFLYAGISAGTVAWVSGIGKAFNELASRRQEAKRMRRREERRAREEADRMALEQAARAAISGPAASGRGDLIVRGEDENRPRFDEPDQDLREALGVLARRIDANSAPALDRKMRDLALDDVSRQFVRDAVEHIDEFNGQDDAGLFYMFMNVVKMQLPPNVDIPPQLFYALKVAAALKFKEFLDAGRLDPKLREPAVQLEGMMRRMVADLEGNPARSVQEEYLLGSARDFLAALKYWLGDRPAGAIEAAADRGLPAPEPPTLDAGRAPASAAGPIQIARGGIEVYAAPTNGGAGENAQPIPEFDAAPRSSRLWTWLSMRTGFFGRWIGSTDRAFALRWAVWAEEILGFTATGAAVLAATAWAPALVPAVAAAAVFVGAIVGFAASGAAYRRVRLSDDFTEARLTSFGTRDIHESYSVYAVPLNPAQRSLLRSVTNGAVGTGEGELFLLVLGYSYSNATAMVAPKRSSLEGVALVEDRGDLDRTIHFLDSTYADFFPSRYPGLKRDPFGAFAGSEKRFDHIASAVEGSGLPIRITLSRRRASDYRNAFRVGGALDILYTGRGSAGRRLIAAGSAAVATAAGLAAASAAFAAMGGALAAAPVSVAALAGMAAAILVRRILAGLASLVPVHEPALPMPAAAVTSEAASPLSALSSGALGALSAPSAAETRRGEEPVASVHRSESEEADTPAANPPTAEAAASETAGADIGPERRAAIATELTATLERTLATGWHRHFDPVVDALSPGLNQIPPALRSGEIAGRFASEDAFREAWWDAASQWWGRLMRFLDAYQTVDTLFASGRLDKDQAMERMKDLRILPGDLPIHRSEVDLIMTSVIEPAVELAGITDASILDHVVDLGGFNGSVAVAFVEAGARRVTALDFDDDMLTLFRANIARLRRAVPIEARHADLARSDWGLEPQSASWVNVRMAPFLLPWHRRRMIRQAFAVLRPGGLFTVQHTFNPGGPDGFNELDWSVNEWRRELSAAGFTVEYRVDRIGEGENQRASLLFAAVKPAGPSAAEAAVPTGQHASGSGQRIFTAVLLLAPLFAAAAAILGFADSDPSSGFAWFFRAVAASVPFGLSLHLQNAMPAAVLAITAAGRTEALDAYNDLPERARWAVDIEEAAHRVTTGFFPGLVNRPVLSFFEEGLAKAIALAAYALFLAAPRAWSASLHNALLVGGFQLQYGRLGGLDRAILAAGVSSRRTTALRAALLAASGPSAAAWGLNSRFESAAARLQERALPEADVVSLQQAAATLEAVEAAPAPTASRVDPAAFRVLTLDGLESNFAALVESQMTSNPQAPGIIFVEELPANLDRLIARYPNLVVVSDRPDYRPARLKALYAAFGPSRQAPGLGRVSVAFSEDARARLSSFSLDTLDALRAALKGDASVSLLLSVEEAVRSVPIEPAQLRKRLELQELARRLVATAA